MWQGWGNVEGFRPMVGMVSCAYEARCVAFEMSGGI